MALLLYYSIVFSMATYARSMAYRGMMYWAQMVKDKITLCRQMLPESAGVDNDEALSEVVGFLEACRPRMVDLVEAGIGGALGEDTFAKCLQVHPRTMICLTYWCLLDTT